MSLKFNPISGQFDLVNPAATPGGSDTQVQFNDSGAFGGSASFTWDGTQLAVIKQTITTPSAGSIPLTIKAALSQTANLIEWQNNSGTILNRIGSAGSITLGSLANSGGGLTIFSTADEATNFQRYRISVNATNVVSYEITKGGTGSHGWHSFKVNGTTVLEVDAAQAIFYGGFLTSPDNTKDMGRLSSAPYRFRSLYLGTSLQAGAAANTPIAGTFHGVSPSASVKTMVLQGAASQTANLTEWRDSAGTIGIAIAANTRDIILDATTGTKIATATSQKLGFWNATPVIQPASANQAAVAATVATTAATNTAPYGYTTAAQADDLITEVGQLKVLVNQLRSELVTIGIIKGSA